MANPYIDNKLYMSWHDSAMIPMLNASNILDYFTHRNNPFYDHGCNNEIIKMQHANLDHLNTMQGVEYALVHAQEPILYVIRQQNRHSPTHVTTIADYYIVAGIVYQAPDLGSVISSRMTNAVNSLESAFEEAKSFSRYHPSKGYWWEFKDNLQTEKLQGKEKKKEEPSSLFQRQRVDMLLAELAQKFPPKIPAVFQPERTKEPVKIEPKQEPKAEKPADRIQTQANHNVNTKPPPEKKLKTMR